MSHDAVFFGFWLSDVAFERSSASGRWWSCARAAGVRSIWRVIPARDARS